MILEITTPVQTGLKQERKMETIANHLANVDTSGFKADILSFDEMLNIHMAVDFTQGDIKMTGNNLDFAISGEGFFKVQTQQGVRYTRSGNFTLNNEGLLVTQNGDPVLGEGGEITIKGTDIYCNEAGEIFVDGTLSDKLDIVTFNSLENLQKEGSSLFVYKGDPADATAPEKVSVKQKALERPNVSTVVEMTKMIETMRTYEALQKMIQSFDETDSKIINEAARI